MVPISVHCSSAQRSDRIFQRDMEASSLSPCQATAQRLGCALSTTLFETPSARIGLQAQIQMLEDDEGTHFHFEPEKNRHFIKATLDEDNVLSFGVRAKGDRTRFGSGTEMFAGLMHKIAAEGLSIDRVKADWQLDTESVNAQALRENIAMGMNLGAAARKTWTGRQLARYGFRPFSIEQFGYCYTVVFKKG